MPKDGSMTLGTKLRPASFFCTRLISTMAGVIAKLLPPADTLPDLPVRASHTAN
jgi:hypothetical protein